MDFLVRRKTKWKTIFVVITRVATSESLITINQFFLKRAIRKEEKSSRASKPGLFYIEKTPWKCQTSFRSRVSSVFLCGKILGALSQSMF